MAPTKSKDGMDISVEAVPPGMTEVSGGRFQSKRPLKGENDGYTQLGLARQSYPIN